MKLTGILVLISIDVAAQVIPIAQARRLRAGAIVTVTGRVTASKEFGDLTFVQDATGGIPVYGRVTTDRGDSVLVTGKLSRFNGLLEILSDSTRKVGLTTKIILPKDVDIRQVKDHEGELIRLTNVLLNPPEHFFYPQRAGLITKGPDTVNYWIDGDTSIPGYWIPASPVSITGVVGRFKDQYQIMPRAVDDIPGIAPPSIARSGQTVAIMNWNVEFFGASRKTYGSEYGPPDEATQVANAARLLNSVQPDVVALQEISDDTAFKSLVNQLPGYEGRCSSRYSYSFDTSNDFPPQKLCFVYKINTVKIVREKVLFRKTYDEMLAPEAFSSGRLPYLIEVDITNNDITRRISLVNIHAKSGATVDDYNRRKYDARLLKDTLDTYYKNVIILGDFNDDLDMSIASQRQSPYKDFASDPAYFCISKKLSDTGWHSTISYDDVIDHQIVSSNFPAISTRVINPFGLIQQYERTTSDHLPVISEFDFRLFVTGVVAPEEVSIYPNPTTDNITIQPHSDFKLFNSLGHEVQFLESQPPGLYFLKASNQVFRIVKQ